MGAAWGNVCAAQPGDALDLPDAAVALDRMAPQQAPPVVFLNAHGKRLSLGDYAGHVLVVNLWATWCGPCVAEIPSLAALAPRLRGNGVLVLPISIDMGGAAVVRKFYADNAVQGLPVLVDPNGTNMQVLQTDSIPYTIIINAAGQMVASTDTAANWNTDDTVTFLQSLAPVKAPMPGFVPI